MLAFLKKAGFFLSPIIVFLVFVISYNTILDPYGVIHGNMDNQKMDCNQRYLKIKHLINNPKKYDSFLFGSSRVSSVDTRKIGFGKWYNMTYSEGLPYEHLEDLKQMLSNGIEVKNILIGVDEISYSSPPERHLTESLRKPYKSEYNPLIDYYLLLPDYDIYKNIRKFKDKEFFIKYDLYETGIPFINLGVTEDHWKSEDHTTSDVFDKPHHMPYYVNLVDQTIEDLKEIQTLCEQNNIRLTLFVSPIHPTTYKHMNKSWYFSFIEKLSQIQPYYDFSGFNSMTSNNANYLETCHYRMPVGDEMIDIMYNNVKPYDDGFGQTVNTSNISLVIQQKKADLENNQK
ncbi:MAG: hypothetical protein H6584_05130 [Flavobacteriales bacterium]|nr:hypothetical protein [Flavobacteriales bacterium]